METKLNDRPILFQETQRFRQPWLWAIILLPMAFMIVALFYPALMGAESVEEPTPFLVIVIFNVIMALVVIGFARAGLITKIDAEGMTYGWSLFSRSGNRVQWDEVVSLSLIKYKFVGYGIRISWSYGVVHNVSGNIGLLIHTKRGKKFMIGTNRPGEMDEAIRKAIEKYPDISYTNALETRESMPRSSGVSGAESHSYG